VDLNALKIFLEVARLGSFTAAAKSLNLAKTSVSSKVQQLEEQLGNRLLNRTTRTVSLTDVGEDIYQLAEQIVQRAQKIEDFAASELTEPKGGLRIAAPSIMVKGFLGDWCIEFLKQYPEVSLQLISTNRAPDFTQDRLDFAFRNLSSLTESDLAIKSLFKFRCGYYASPDLIRQHPALTHPGEFKEWPCVGFSVDGQVNPWLFNTEGAEQGIQPETSLCFDDAQLVKRATVLGLGVAYMSCLLAESDVNAGRLEPLLTEFWPAAQHTCELYQPREHMALKNRVFIEFVEEKSQQIAPYVS